MAHVSKRTRSGQIVWRARYTDPSGRQREQWFDRRADARRWLTAMEAAKQQGAFVDPALGATRLGDWAWRWFEGGSPR